MAQLEGESRDVANNFLGSEFWQPGTSVAGTVLRKFESANGLCYGLQLSEPVCLNEQETSEVALGNLTGLRMALQAAGVGELQVGDEIQLECTGLQPTNKGNDRIDFKIHIDRANDCIEARFSVTSELDTQLMYIALQLAREGLRTPGGGEVGAVIAIDGKIVGSGFNEGELQHDSTAHAEMVAIRRM